MSKFCRLCGKRKTLYKCDEFTCRFPFSKKSQPMRYKNESEKKAQLIYEEAIKGYCFKFTSGFSKAVIDILKKGIPSNKRETSGAPEWKWYFGEEYFELIKLALQGAGFQTTIVTKEEVENLRKKQEEANRSVYKPAVHSINDELKKFTNLLLSANIGDFTLEMLSQWNREAATKAYRRAALYYHPDRNGGNGEKMSILNSTWNILKEGYYIK